MISKKHTVLFFLLIITFAAVYAQDRQDSVELKLEPYLNLRGHLAL